MSLASGEVSIECGTCLLCLSDYTICQTIHRINVRTGRTSLLNKRCALPSECTVDVVGCHDTHVPGEQVSQARAP